MLKKTVIIFLMVLAMGQEARASCSCTCINGQVEPICTGPVELPPICSPQICY